jgi:hypothetical protein
MATNETKQMGLRFLAGFVLAGILYGVTVYTVNPVRDFAGGPVSAFPAVRSDYRSEKIALLDRYLKQGPVDGVILGSSRSMLLNGTRMSSMPGAGNARFFNFGLASAKGEDFLAALRWTARRQGGHMPRFVVIGVDVESLRDAKAHGDSIHPLRHLATGDPAITEQLRTLVSRTVTWSYARDTFFSIYLRLFPRKPAVEFLDDGTMRYAARDAARQAGVFSLEASMAGCMADCRTKIESTTRISRTQVDFLRQTVREARDGGADVAIWLTGPHPRTAAHMAQGTAYAELVRQSLDTIRAIDPKARVFDFHNSSSYGGDTTAWYDCNHFDDTHARRIEHALMANAPSAGASITATATAKGGSRGF